MTSKRIRYPWRLGAPSFVVAGDIAENVAVLAPLVDAVQLLFFESRSASTLPQPIDLEFLAEQAALHDLRYTVHLPTDLRLGADDPGGRRQAVEEIAWLTSHLAPLSPVAYDLHLLREPGLAEAQWRANLEQGLMGLAEVLGEGRRLVAVENIDYPFALVADLVAAAGLGRCLDLGHLVRYGHGDGHLPDGLARVAHIHYHGVERGRDHRALTEAGEAACLGQALAAAGYSGVITLEMYSLERLEASLALLAEAWHPFSRIE
ncbi:MAG: cobamide remodeling phosphodiesterase CbiR [Thermodesulfobacteriota bacterium]